MPTLADLERLRALTERLTPLGGAAQGELIRAEDWNTLVGAVGELARVVLAEDRQAVPVPHTHADQVSVGWLEPRLRALIERGPLSDPAAEARLQALEQRIERLAGRIEAVLGNLGEVRDRVTEVTTRDLVRQAEVLNVRRAVEGLDDGREAVRELRTTLGSLQRDVATAVTVGQRLTVNGSPIDFNQVFERLARTDELRDRLTAPDGTLLDARTLENRLTDLTNTLVTQATLDDALARVRRELSPDELGAIEGNLRNQLLEQFDRSLSGLGDELRAESNERFAGIDPRIESRIADAIPDISAVVLNSVRPEVSTLITTTRTDLETLIEKQTDVLGRRLTTDYSTQIEQLRSGIGEQVGAALATRLDEQMGSFSRRLGQLEENVKPLSERVQQLEVDVRVIRGQGDLLRTEIDLSAGRVRTELINTIDQRDQLQASRFDGQLRTLDAQISQRTTDALGDSRRIVLEEARSAARDAARLEAGGVETRLRTELGSLNRSALSELVRSEINAATPGLTRSIGENLRRPLGPG